MIRVKRFVIEHAVDFITILEEDFHELFPAFEHDIIDRIPELLSYVYMSCINYFCQCLFYFIFRSGQSV